MAELVPIVESGDLKNVVFQNDMQFLFATDPAFEGMTLEVGPNGWVVFNRASNANTNWNDTNAASVALTPNVESSAICAVTPNEDIPLNAGTYLLSYRYSSGGGPATVTTRVYVDAILQATQVSQIEANVSDRTITFSGSIAAALFSGQSVSFTVESSIAASVDGPNYTSVLRTTSVKPLVAAAYGGIQKQTDTNYGTIASDAWTLVDNWDSGAVLLPVGVTQDVANSGLRVDTQGVFSFTGSLAISFTDVNRGRRFGVRLWNDTKSTAGREVEYFIGRNQEGVNIIQGGLFVEIGASEVGDLLQLQIAGLGGEDYSNVIVLDGLFSVQKISGSFA